MTEIDEQRLYANIVGHVPSEISDRIKVGMEADPKLTKMFEDIRLHVMESDVLDAKTVQMILFAMMAAKLIGPPTEYHAVAAKMAGASKEELYAVAGLTLLAGGMRSYNTAGAAIAAAFDISSDD
jgi:4-carboxymuconolactone decarboxylase